MLVNTTADEVAITGRPPLTTRRPPLTPEEMTKAIATRTFTAGSDREVVAKIYASFFAEMSQPTNTLNLPNFHGETSDADGWSVLEICSLALALPSFSGCTEIILAHHRFMGETEADQALATALSRMPKLERFDMRGSREIPWKLLTVLAQLPVLHSLSMTVCDRQLENRTAEIFEILVNSESLRELTVELKISEGEFSAEFDAQKQRKFRAIWEARGKRPPRFALKRAQC